MKFRLGLNAEKISDRIDPRLDGVGMIRGEYPCRLIDEYFTLESCREYLYNYIESICKVYNNKEVWYRNADFIVQEVNVLKGADRILDENDYILGLRGIRRGIRYIDVFKLELEIITQLSKKYSNLNILFSFIKDTEELQKCIDVLKELGFENKYGIMAEIPSVIIDIENFIDMGISNITIGVNDLTTLVLGTYRTSGFHDCNHEAVLKCIERCVKVTRGTNISVSVGGYVNRDLLNNCKKIGVDYFIVTYPLLNEILNVPLKKLEYINQLDEIKRKTKGQRNKELIKKYQKLIIESGRPLDKRYRCQS